MVGPSGFFVEDNMDPFFAGSDTMELLHESEAGFNVLYKVRKGGRFFVYKALKKNLVGVRMYEDLLKKDFDIGFSMQHPNICQYYGYINAPGIGNCIVMEWVDGITLQEFLQSPGRRKASSSVADRIVCEICSALDYMHRKQIVHRDLKPENIMLTYNGMNVKVIDFGLSDADSYAILKAPAGTMVYASPELLAGEQVDGRSDLWSLGVILGELGCRYSSIARKCLKRNPDERCQYADEVISAVRSLGRARMRALAAVAVLCLLAGGIYRFSARADLLSGEHEILPVPDSSALVQPGSAAAMTEDIEDSVRAEKPMPDSGPQAAGDSRPCGTLRQSDLDDLLKAAAEAIGR